jgi:hypothetical protein
MEDTQNEKLIAILRLKELEIPFDDFKDLIDFFNRDSLNKQTKLVELLIDGGIAPQSVKYGVHNIDLGIQSSKFHTAIRLRYE